ncbi:putative undecaprenyl-phosphate N-acetylglucosaminyl 1-phosphate transferase [bacterium BMS3Abin04]|nr:putative undecaprenyl-phosphate N-acetylglucosaminyl 1-phosphate transferase [bacterium BMS3Abin04]
MTYLLVFVASFITTIFLTPYFISILKKASIVDVPGGRKLHSQTIPRMGGLVIFLVVLTILNAFVQDFDTIKLLLVSSTILVLVGIIDDVIGLDSFVKFVFQNIAAVVLIIYLENKFTAVELLGITLVEPLNYLFLLLFIVGTINSINLLDGLDGLASGFALLIFSIILALAIHKNDTFIILITTSLIGSLVGFLRFNAFPASIFLGDTGAYILGFFFVLTTSLTSIDYNNKVLDLTFPIILLGLPLIDTVKVFVVRIINKHNPFEADTSHQHYILYKNNIKHEVTVFLIEIFTLIFILLAIFYLQGLKVPSLILFFLFTILLLMIEPFLKTINVSAKVIGILNRLKEMRIKHLKGTLKLLILLSSLLVVAISVLSFSFKSSLNMQELIFLVITMGLLLFLAFLQFQKTKQIAHLYIFLNFVIFFIVSKLSLPSLLVTSMKFSDVISIHDISFYFLVVLIVISLLYRWNYFRGKKILFTGIDLTMIVFILLTFIINKILQFDFNYYLSISLLEAFIFFIWFKVVSDLNRKYELYLAFYSFILPIALLLTLLILRLT